MPIIKSAKKRVKTARKATVRNAKTRRSVKVTLKNFGKSASAKTFNAAQSELGKASKKHVYHKNKVARKQRQLAAASKAAGVKQTAAKPTVKKSTPKKPAVKRSPVAAKKAPAKKPTTKK